MTHGPCDPRARRHRICRHSTVPHRRMRTTRPSERSRRDGKAANPPRPNTASPRQVSVPPTFRTANEGLDIIARQPSRVSAQRTSLSTPFQSNLPARDSTASSTAQNLSGLCRTPDIGTSSTAAVFARIGPMNKPFLTVGQAMPEIESAPRRRSISVRANHFGIRFARWSRRLP
jgi:hypothetical protein